MPCRGASGRTGTSRRVPAGERAVRGPGVPGGAGPARWSAPSSARGAAGHRPRAVRPVPRAVRPVHTPSRAGQARGRVGERPARCGALRSPPGRCHVAVDRQRTMPAPRERGGLRVAVRPRRAPARARRRCGAGRGAAPESASALPCRVPASGPPVGPRAAWERRWRRGVCRGAWEWPEPGREPSGRGVKARLRGTWTPWAAPVPYGSGRRRRCLPPPEAVPPAVRTYRARPGRPVERQGCRAAGPDL